MKKNIFNTLGVLILFVCINLIPGMYNTEFLNNIEKIKIEKNGIEPKADVIYYVHTTLNGIRMHRLWNQTQNRYEGTWSICNCK